MDARAKSLRFLGDGKQLTIPFFQRSYVWKKENWEELLHSFENKDVVPFLGSIILKDVPDPFNPGERMVIDGQQRLTTITLLAKAIWDSLPAESKEDSGIIDDIKAFLFYKVNVSDKFKQSHVRIRHSRLDNDMYSKVIRAGLFADAPLVDLEKLDPAASKIAECYFYFRGMLKNKTEKELEALHDAIFSDENKVFVLIALEHKDVNEQSIFDTINRAGIRLSAADIIKNAIFKACLDRATVEGIPEATVLDLYDTYWDKLFYENSDKRKQWDTKRIFGNVERTNLEFLLYCVATIKWGKHKSIFSNLDIVYNEKIEKYTYSQLEELVREISTYGDLFSSRVLDFQDALLAPETLPSIKFVDHVDRLMLILEKFGVQMFYPYVLKRIVDADFNYQDEGLLHDFRILESFVVRRRISGKGVTDYAIKCDRIIREPQGLQNVLVTELVSESSQLNDADFAAGCSKITNAETAKIILFCIELYRRQDPKYDYNSLYYNYSLEHILPQKWEKYWHDIPVYNEDGSIFEGEDEAKRAIRNKVKHNLGNFVLLKDKLNASLSNKTFDVKVNGNGKYMGYRKYASLSTTSEIVDIFDSGIHEWNEKTIYGRAESLVKEAIMIWPNFSEEAPQPPQTSKSTGDVHQLNDQVNIVSVSVESLSGDAFDDPIKMLSEIDRLSGNTRSAQDNTLSAEPLVELEDFISCVNAQRETIVRLIRNGEIIPDLVKQTSASRSEKYFKKESIQAYARKYGWLMIADENRKDLFFQMVEQMKMSYSYKPVFLKAVFELADSNGCVSLRNIVSYFQDFYLKRHFSGYVTEKPDSVFANPDCTPRDAEKVILQYPYDRFKTMQVVTMDENSEMMMFNKKLWKDLSQDEKRKIRDICDQKLAAYFEQL